MLAPPFLYILLWSPAPFCSRYSMPSVTPASVTPSYIFRPGELPQHFAESSFRIAVRNSFIFTIELRKSSSSSPRASWPSAWSKPFRGRGMIRFLMLLPWVAPIALGAIGWKWILDSIYSVISWVLRRAPFVQAVQRPHVARRTNSSHRVCSSASTAGASFPFPP